MMGWLKNKAPFPATEKSRSDTSPLRGEVAAERRVMGPSAEGAFHAENCAIWNDIRRALEAK